MVRDGALAHRGIGKDGHMLYDGPPSAIRPTRTALQIARGRVTPNGYLVTLRGELDIQTAADLRTDLTTILAERPLPDHVVVDLQGVTFMDSLGLGTLVVGHRICGDLGVRFTVRNPSTFVTHLLRVSGFAEQLLGPHA
jgi:anti-anti-sigma factor